MTDTTLPPTQYMTVGEVAEDLRVAKMTVYRMINAGLFPALRIGHRTYRIPAQGYQAYKRQLHQDAEQRAARAGTPDPIPGQTEIIANGSGTPF